MIKEEFIKAIQEGRYKLIYEEHCDCEFRWDSYQSDIYCADEFNGEDCWHGVVLYIGDFPCIRRTIGEPMTYAAIGHYEPLFEFEDVDKNPVEVVEEISKDILSEMDSIAYTEYDDNLDPDKYFVNPAHEERKEKSLQKFLSTLEVENGNYLVMTDFGG